MVCYMYILKCNDNTYYTGSTKNLERRLSQHQNGEGANYTKKRLPVKLIYFEEYNRIDEAFYREKQVQGWSRKKKEAIIDKYYEKLNLLAECKNESHYLIQEALKRRLSVVEIIVTVSTLINNPHIHVLIIIP